MKKILLIGKFNNVVNEMNAFLAQFFHVQQMQGFWREC